MAAPTVINGDTSLILVDSRNLTAGQAAVVLLSSIQAPGRTVTVRDSVGFLSSPQTIVLSTMNSVRFVDGTSSVRITQPFGFISVTSRDASSWYLTNTFGFPQNQTIANAFSVAASTVTTRDLYAISTVSTAATTTQTATITSTAFIQGPAYVSTLITGAPFPAYQPITTDPGYSLYVQGNMRVLSNLDIDGTTRVGGNISTASNVVVAGTISCLGSFGSRGDIQTLGNIFAPLGGLFTTTIDVRGAATVGGQATFCNNLFITSSLGVTGSISSAAITTSSLQTISQVGLQEKTITYRGNDLLFSAPISVPGISTQQITASNSILTSTLTVTGSITAEQTAFLTLSSAAITNPAGSLVISSLQANVATVSSFLSTQQLQTSSLAASTLTFSGDLIAAAPGYLTLHTVAVSSLSTSVVAAGAIQTSSLSTPSLSTNTLFLTGSLLANSLSSFSALSTTIQATGGSLETQTITTRQAVITSTLSNTSGLILSPTSSLRIVASNTIIPVASFSSLITSSMITSSFQATRLTVGSPPNSLTNGPNFDIDPSYPSTNVTITGGPGDYLTPFFISNVAPPGIGPGDPYTVDASFYLNFNGPVLPGYYATILGLTLNPNGESNSIISIRTYNDSNTLVSLYGLYGTVQTYATPSGTGGIPVPALPLPSSFIHVTGTMYGTSAFSLQFQSRFNDSFTSIDSNVVITMNNGVLRWPYFLNGTTIQNSLNDIAVRNLYYYGSLNFASDPALKEQISYADLSRCSEIIQAIPLKRYKYIDSYLSTFHIADTHRLGILATDLESYFPKSITYTKLDGFSTVRLVDTQQLEMAHIGTTQALMRQVAALRSTVTSLTQFLTNH